MPRAEGAPAPLLRAVQVRRSFGAARVLRGVDLTVSAGQALLVTGPNGAGKTTLLRILAGLMRPTGGDVEVLGERFTAGSADLRRAIGLLSHRSLLYDDLTVHENLVFAARLYGLDEPNALAHAVLADAGLAAYGDESPRRLSRGLRQRAAIARALLHRPRILLLDEPFTSLDAAAAERLRRQLWQQLAEGLGLVIVTHQLGEVWELGGHVAVMASGRWVIDEPCAGPLDAFLSRYVEAVGG